MGFVLEGFEMNGNELMSCEYCG